MDFGYLFFSLKGRIARMPFLIGMIVMTVLIVILDVVDAVLASDMTTTSGMVFSSLLVALYALVSYCGLTLMVKRLHDLGHSGWYVAGAFLLTFGANFLMLTPLSERSAAIAWLVLSLPSGSSSRRGRITGTTMIAGWAWRVSALRGRTDQEDQSPPQPPPHEDPQEDAEPDELSEPFEESTWHIWLDAPLS